MNEIKKIGMLDDDPVELPGGQVVAARSSSRFAMLLVAVGVVGVWSLVNVVNVWKATAEHPANVADFPVNAAVLVICVMLAKDKPLDKLAEIAAALKK